jgi:hypothetical protein
MNSNLINLLKWSKQNYMNLNLINLLHQPNQLQPVLTVPLTGARATIQWAVAAEAKVTQQLRDYEVIVHSIFRFTHVSGSSMG